MDKNLGKLNGLSLEQTGRIKGLYLIAERIVVTCKNGARELTLQEFVQPGYLAFYLNKSKISQGEQAILIRVREG